MLYLYILYMILEWLGFVFSLAASCGAIWLLYNAGLDPKFSVTKLEMVRYLSFSGLVVPAFFVLSASLRSHAQSTMEKALAKYMDK